MCTTHMLRACERGFQVYYDLQKNMVVEIRGPQQWETGYMGVSNPLKSHPMVGDGYQRKVTGVYSHGNRYQTPFRSDGRSFCRQIKVRGRHTLASTIQNMKTKIALCKISNYCHYIFPASFFDSLSLSFAAICSAAATISVLAVSGLFSLLARRGLDLRIGIVPIICRGCTQ